MANSPRIKLVSECFIRPKLETNSINTKQPYCLAPNDLALLSAHYIQKGLLYTKPPSTAQGDKQFDVESFLERLKGSLARALVQFYPLVGQLETEINEDQHSSLIFVDCSKGPGVRFIHASLDVTNSDILSPTDVPQIVQSFFDHDRALNHDSHIRPLLSVQVTELIDGIFIGCSMNHAVCDGTSFWHFWNIWSQLHTSYQAIANPPIHDRWFPEGCGPGVTLPFTDPGEFLKRYEAPKLRERIFHFSSDSLLKLKKKANAEAGEAKGNISSFQALSALAWRAITRARCLAPNRKTTCNLDANLRHRLEPPLPQEYFGNLIWVATAASTAGELLEQNLGWAARLLNRAVAELTDKQIRGGFATWIQSPFLYHIDSFFDSSSVVIGSSPRFNAYGNEFGLGKAVAVRSGYASKYPGKITAYPGFEGEGSTDLEICLPPESMRALELDDEFTAVVTHQ